MVGIGGADQGEIAFIGDGEKYPPIGVLAKISPGIGQAAADDNMRPPHQPHPQPGPDPGPVQQVEHPRPGGIDDGSGGDDPGLSIWTDQVNRPAIGPAHQPNRAVARQDQRAAPRRIAGVQHHHPRIIDPAIAIFEPMGKAGVQRRARRVLGQLQPPRRRQQFAPANMVIQEQPQPDQPARAQFRVVRQHKAQRPDDVRGHGPQPLALHQRLAHQREFIMFQIAQSAMDQLG